MSIRRLAFHVRKHILMQNIKVTLRTMRIQFKQNILDAYLEKLKFHRFLTLSDLVVKFRDIFFHEAQEIGT